MEKYIFATYIFALICALFKLIHYFFEVVKVNVYLKEDRPLEAPVDKKALRSWHKDQLRKIEELKDFGIEELRK
jgi:hypothetical protein